MSEPSSYRSRPDYPPGFQPSGAGRLTFGGLWREFVGVVERNGTMLLAGAAILIGLDVLSHLAAGEAVSNVVGSIVSLFAPFLLIREMLRAERLIEREGGVWSWFLASLIAGLGVLAGLVLLVLPGLYLLARWSIAPALVLARSIPAVDALKESWRATGDAAWTLLGFYLVAGVSVMIAIGVVYGTIGLATTTLATVVVSALSDLLLVGSAALSVAIYRLLAGPKIAVAAHTVF